MSRRRRAERREVLPDAKFGDTVLTRFMNALMYDGKKSAAEGIVYGALDVMKKRGGATRRARSHCRDHLGRLAPYFERLFLRSLTPCVSSTPRST